MVLYKIHLHGKMEMESQVKAVHLLVGHLDMYIT